MQAILNPTRRDCCFPSRPIFSVLGATTFSRDDLVSGIFGASFRTLSSLPGNLGGCYQAALASPGFDEMPVPATNTGWFYLVTAINRLREEGTTGTNSAGVKRPNAAASP
jgi:hypothetical protein